MTKSDYRSFLNLNNIKRMLKGKCNIWLCDPNEDFGFKIFSANDNEASIFWAGTTTPTGWPVPQRRSTVLPLLSKEDMEDLFRLLQDMYEIGAHPQPLEMFEYKSVYGIKIRRADPIGRISDIRKHIPFGRLKTIFSESHIYKMKQKPQDDSFGLVDGKIMFVDVDIEDLNNTLKRIERDAVGKI